MKDQTKISKHEMAKIPLIDTEKINLTTVKNLLSQQHININMIFPISNGLNHFMSLLSIAVLNSDEELVRYLISQKADINLSTSWQGTAFTLAVKMGNLKMVKILKQLGADMNIRNRRGETSLHTAVRRNYLDVAEFLLQNGADVNATVAGSSSLISLRPLHLAVCFRLEKMVQLILDYNADIDARTSTGETALLKTGLNGDVEIFKLLVARGANCSSACPNQTIIHDLLSYTRQTSVLEYLLSLDESYADVEIRTKSGETLLHYNLFYGYGNSDISNLLLDAGVDVNAVNSEGKLPIDLQKINNSGFLVIRQHIVKLISAGMEVCQRNRQAVAEGLEDFGNECFFEIEKMKNKKVGRSYVTFFNVLTMGTHYLSIRFKFVDLDGIIDKKMLRSEFPLYGGMLYHKLSKIYRRIKIMEKIEKFGEDKLCEFGFPYVLVRNLWYYFRNFELKQFIL